MELYERLLREWYRPRMNRIPLFLLVMTIGLSMAAAEATPTTVILVRHAEKAALDGDPPLSAAGHARARELARVLSGAGVDVIYVTQYLRTQSTAQPLADVLGIEPRLVKAGGKEYAAAVAKEIREQHRGKTVLVVGHLNTTVDVLRELGIKELPVIPEPQFDDLFVVTLAGGAAPSLVSLRYGAAAR